MDNEDARLFGTIAVRSELITKPQLTRALMTQEMQDGPDRQLIGEILVEMKALKSVDVQHVIQVQHVLKQENASIRFGLIAIQNGYATKDQVTDCLKLQRQSAPKRDIGEIMLQKGLLSEEQVDGINRGLKRLEGEGGKPASRLVQAVRRIDEGGAMTTQRQAATGARMDDVKNLVETSVRGMTHLGIVSHIIHRQADSYTLKEFAKNLSDDKKDIQQALEELVEGEVLIPIKGLLSTKYSYTPDLFMQQRVELLMSFVNDQKTRQEVLDYIQGR